MFQTGKEIELSKQLEDIFIMVSYQDGTVLTISIDMIKAHLGPTCGALMSLTEIKSYITKFVYVGNLFQEITEGLDGLSDGNSTFKHRLPHL